jgi:hypothetical protein
MKPLKEGPQLKVAEGPERDGSRQLNAAAIYSFFLITLLISGCQGCRRQLPVTRISAGDREYPIRKWELIGPFTFDPKEISPGNPDLERGGLNRDFLAPIGYPENSLSVAALLQLPKKIPSSNFYEPSGFLVPLDRLYPGSRFQVIYALAEIVSDAEMDLAFEVGSDDGVKVWINNQLVISTSNLVNRAAFKNSEVVQVHLNKGPNILVAKVDQKVDTWDLIASFLPLSRAQAIECKNADNHLLKNRILRDVGVLRPRLPGLCNDRFESFSVVDINGRSVMSGILSKTMNPEVDITSLSDGYYKLILVGRSNIYTDIFFKGTPERAYSNLLDQQMQSPTGSDEFYARDALLKRYRILTSPRYSLPLDPDWQKKLLYVLEESSKSLSNRSGQRWTQVPGMHFREYLSEIDGQPQNYVLYVPRSAKNGSTPLVIVLPFAEDPVRPFLESTLITWPESLEGVMRAAEDEGFSVAITNGRGGSGSAPIGESDILEVLTNVEHSFDIDAKRVYLFGVCEGGLRALMLAEHYPQDFAAVATYGPLLSRPPQDRSTAAWEEGEGVVALSGNLTAMHVLLTKGQFDDEPPTEAITNFFTGLRIQGAEVQLELLQDGLHKMKDLESMLFPFFKGKVLNSLTGVSEGDRTVISCVATPKGHAQLQVQLLGQQRLEIKSAATNHIQLLPDCLGFANGSSILITWNGIQVRRVYRGAPINLERGSGSAEKSEEPQAMLADLFAEPFIVLAADGSSRTEIEALTQLWEKNFFVPFRLKRENSVTPMDLRRYNVLFVGVPSTHTRLARAVRKLSLSVSDSHKKMTLVDADIQGKQFAAVFENPLQREKLLGVVRLSSQELLSHPPNLPFDGFYTSAVWSDRGALLHAANWLSDVRSSTNERKPLPVDR